MKRKNNSEIDSTPVISPEAAVQFLDDFRKLAGGLDEPTVAINIRIPANLLRSIKAKAKMDGKKYQSLMIEFVRRGLSDS